MMKLDDNATAYEVRIVAQKAPKKLYAVVYQAASIHIYAMSLSSGIISHQSHFNLIHTPESISLSVSSVA